MESLFEEKREDEDRISLFADVILPVPIPAMFTYRVPRNMEGAVGIGYRVIVQFGKNKILTGIVGRVHRKPPKAYEAKPILDFLDDHPVVNPLQIRFWQWMADYYCCHPGEVMNAALPTGLKLSSESKIQLSPHFDEFDGKFPIDGREQIILTALRSKEALTYDECEKLLGVKSAYAIIKSLVTKEAVLVFEQIKEKYAPKVESRIKLNEAYVSDQKRLKELFEELSTKPKQEAILLKYLQTVPVYQKPELNTSGVVKTSLTMPGLSASSLKTMIKNGVFVEFKNIVSRFNSVEPIQKNIVLEDFQQEAVKQIKQQFEEKQTVLLHGVTGSGKTEIYTQLVLEVLDSGSQVLLLLPEIALTTQVVSRLQRVFGSKMGIYHSKYSDNERVEVWQRVLNGQYSFVVGVRSSIFLPFDSLGLVIVDEEHETSYKQYDPAPRFHARDAAIMLAFLHQAKTLLGTATPSFESYYNAGKNKYGYTRLDQRYGKAVLPEFLMANILADQKKNLLKLDFTRTLRERIQEALNRQEQVLIFQNRRGYAPYISCGDCGWIPQCEHCDVSLTYHQYKEEMRCHYCGFKEKPPRTCPACQGNKLTSIGLGTERIEESLSLLFPEARIRRMDLETTRSKQGYQKILEEFGAANIDILVGTQMITKGLDFDKVTVVGIVDADRILYFPDFRAAERAFHQITQVAGRAGRRSTKGTVVIQSRRPENPLFAQIIQQDFKAFYLRELPDRKKFFYPPFVKLIKILIKHKDAKIAEQAARHLAELLRGVPINKIILGPEKGLVSKIKNLYLYEILIKLDKSGNSPAHFKQELAKKILVTQVHKKYKAVRFIIDVDPY